MLRVKKLYQFMLQTFLPQFMMTFLICLFIVMMHFLWRRLEDLVGKGLDIDVIGEMFFYAALSMVPLALPLSILLASIMTFGNLGEHVELTAMKSSGISLLKIMAPLIVLVSAVSVGAFFFQDNVLPKSQVKMWTLVYSMKQKSPTLDIPEGAVYTQIPNYNIFVRQKNEQNDMLHGLLIYDVNSGMGNPRIVAADSGRLSFTDDGKHLVLDLYHGNWYEDMQSSGGGSQSMGTNMYRRESFSTKKIFIPYDNNFTRLDDDIMRQQFVGKNIKELQATIDSVQARVDSVGDGIAQSLRSMPVVGVPTRRMVIHDKKPVYEVVKPVVLERPVNFDSILSAQPPIERQMLIDQAMMKVQNIKQDCIFRGFVLDDDNFQIRRHKIEMLKKYALSLACLIFFFIGAPLGAIIRKGGLGMPIVVSVALFVVYYVIDNMGYKLARDGRWPVWQGIWLSSAVLLPLGIFLTKKAVDDSAVFNPDTYMNFLKRFTGLHQTRHLGLKEVVIEDVDTDVALDKLASLHGGLQEFAARNPKPQNYLDYWRKGFDRAEIDSLSQDVDSLVDYMSNSVDQMVINKLMDFPIIRKLMSYQPCRNVKVGTACAVLFPLGLPVYLVGRFHQKQLLKEIKQTIVVTEQLSAILRGEYDREMEYHGQ